MKFLLAYVDNVINNVPHFIFWKNTDSIFLGCNIAFAKAAGFQSPDDVIGKTDHEMPWCDNADQYLEDDKRIMELVDAKLDYEEEQRQADGGTKTMLVSKVPMLGADKKTIIGVLGVYTDITQRKKIEQALLEAKQQAEEANNAKTRFLEEMRHDIRTPLSGIVGIAELLNTISDKDKAQEYTKWLLASSQELMEFLNNVLDSVNSSSGHIPISIQGFNLCETIERVVKLHQAKAFEKGLALNFYVDPNIPTFLMGDPMRIYRIVLELLSNALKFTEKGSVDVRVLLGEKTEGNSVVRLEIHDTGPGIPKDRQVDLFTRFNRLTPSYKGLYQGSGLGLSIAKTFAEDLEGTLHVESDGKTGSQFICLFPLQKAALL
ncbi:MAG: PAS domain-containing protein [Gammaproteobacteria bacterium]|nr:PAS domain-containing protein [Gammaproteobacteria bacterium]MBP9764304.1 PAS domain-containing protein [Gammaproteobacteria bacterium]